MDPTEPEPEPEAGAFPAETAHRGAERDAETPEEDAVEQRAEVGPHQEDEPVSLQDEADEADSVEQARSAGLDDEDDGYR